MENEIENVNSSITQNETANEPQLTVDDYNKLKAERDELEAKNAKLYARLQKEKETKVTESKPLVETQNSTYSQDITTLKLQVQHGISDPDAIAFVMKNGGEAALSSPYVKAAVDAIVAQKKAEAAAIQNDSSKSGAEKKYSTAELKSMPSSELEKILPHA